jgi:hypothetical protein
MSWPVASATNIAQGSARGWSSQSGLLDSAAQSQMNGARCASDSGQRLHETDRGNRRDAGNVDWCANDTLARRRRGPRRGFVRHALPLALANPVTASGVDMAVVGSGHLPDRELAERLRKNAFSWGGRRGVRQRGVHGCGALAPRVLPAPAWIRRDETS